MKKIATIVWKWLASDARWFMSADWKWGIPILIYVAVMGGLYLAGFRIIPLLGIEVPK